MNDDGDGGWYTEIRKCRASIFPFYAERELRESSDSTDFAISEGLRCGVKERYQKMDE